MRLARQREARNFLSEPCIGGTLGPRHLHRQISKWTSTRHVKCPELCECISMLNITAAECRPTFSIRFDAGGDAATFFCGGSRSSDADNRHCVF
jgi:hypothetical protein